MGIFGKRKNEGERAFASGVQTGREVHYPFGSIKGYVPLSVNYGIYKSLREQIPIIDSAVNKIVRLMGGFEFVTGSEELDRELNSFFSSINVGGNQKGIQAFTDGIMNQLLTCGTAIGEIVCDDNGIYALYIGTPEYVDVKRRENSLELDFYNTSYGAPRLIQHPERLIYCVLNPEADALTGTSLLRGLPFVSDVLMKIFSATGSNWERAGNLRYAVTYIPQGDGADRAFAKERAEQMAQAWRDAMGSKDCVKDFVAVGDVRVSVIGADNQVLDSEVPVRQMLEQIIAKTGLMPYMLGLNWSTSERMAKQQTDILTTELEAYRRIITPELIKIAQTYLRINGINRAVEVSWDNITLQDETELAQARLYNAEADKLIKETENERK